MKTKYQVILAIVIFSGIVSYWGYIKDKNIIDNQAQAIGTITDVRVMTGDTNVPKVKRAVESFRVSYSYQVDGQVYTAWDIVNRDDFSYGFPVDFREGTRIQIVYNKLSPEDHKLKCKIR